MQIEVMTLDSVCEFIADCEHKTAPTQLEGYPSIRTPNIGKGRLILEGVNRVSEETYEQWTRRGRPQFRDLILAREAPVGNVAIVPKGLNVCLGQRTVLIRPNPEKILPEYLLYLLLGDDIQGRFKSISNGATVHHLNLKDIRGLVLPTLPSAEDQRRIAVILSAYDDLIENNTRRIAVLEEMARRIYEEWFVHFRYPGHEQAQKVETELGLVPEGWEIKPMSECIELAYGKALKAENRIPGPFPVYGSSGVVGSHESALVAAPGIVVGRKGNVGSVFWAHEPFYPIDTAYYVKTKLPLLYVFHNLQKQNFINNDAAVPGLSRNQAYLLPVIIPAQVVLDLFLATCQPIHNLQITLGKKNANLRQTRDLLLPRLISGELDVSTLVLPDAA